MSATRCGSLSRPFGDHPQDLLSDCGRNTVDFHMWKTIPVAFPLVVEREESRALMNLADLLSKDLTKVDTEELAAGIRDAELTGAEAPKWSAAMVQELRDRDTSWSTIVRLTGLPQTTLWRRANPNPEK